MLYSVQSLQWNEECEIQGHYGQDPHVCYCKLETFPCNDNFHWGCKGWPYYCWIMTEHGPDVIEYKKEFELQLTVDDSCENCDMDNLPEDLPADAMDIFIWHYCKPW